LFTLCAAGVSALVILLSDSPNERIGKLETFCDFERGQIVDDCLAGASVTKTTTLLGLSIATVSKVRSECMNCGNTTSAKRKIGKNQTDGNRSSYIEKDCSEKSRNYCSTGNRTAEMNIEFENPVSTKTVRRELHRSNILGRAAIAKFMSA
jgi:hypothetical protein